MWRGRRLRIVRGRARWSRSELRLLAGRAVQGPGAAGGALLTAGGERDDRGTAHGRGVLERVSRRDE